VSRAAVTLQPRQVDTPSTARKGRRAPRQHGTLAMAAPGRGGCTCAPCADAYSRYNRRNAKQRAAGLVQLVPADRARTHVRQLLAAGVEVHEVERRSGVHRTAIRVLLGTFPGRKPSRRIRPETEARLLAVHPAIRPVTGATVDGTGTRRRLQALMANGWTAGELAQRLGASSPNLQIAKRARVRGATAIAVRRLYTELENTPGPSQRAATYWRGRGYLPPAYWDTDTIDDPAAEPEAREYDEHGALLRDLTAWRVDECDRLHRQGLDPGQIAERLGCTRRQARRALAAVRDDTQERAS
jgi:AraC-like DNA-binding protein